MKIRNSKIMLIAPFLFLTPMMCRHLGDDHHSGYYSYLCPQNSHQSSINELAAGDIGGMKEMTRRLADGFFNKILGRLSVSAKSLQALSFLLLSSEWRRQSKGILRLSLKVWYELVIERI